MSLSIVIWLIDDDNVELGAIEAIELGAVEDADAGLVAAVAAAFGTARPGGGIVPSKAPKPPRLFIGLFRDEPASPVASPVAPPNRAPNRA